MAAENQGAKTGSFNEKPFEFSSSMRAHVVNTGQTDIVLDSQFWCNVVTPEYEEIPTENEVRFVTRSNTFFTSGERFEVKYEIDRSLNSDGKGKSLMNGNVWECQLPYYATSRNIQFFRGFFFDTSDGIIEQEYHPKWDH